MSESNGTAEAPEHPALKNFSEPAEYAKYTLKSALKGAIKGAMIGSAAVVVLSMVAGGAAFAWIPIIGPILGSIAGAGLGATLAGAGFGALAGAKWGGLLGGGFGLLDAESHVAIEKERRKDTYDRNEMRQEQAALMQQQMEQQQLASMHMQGRTGLMPGQGLPRRPDIDGMGIG